MIKNVQATDNIFTEGGLTLRLSKGQYLVWEPTKSGAFQLLEGTLNYVGKVKKSYNHFQHPNAVHAKESFKYFIKVGITPVNNVSSKEDSAFVSGFQLISDLVVDNSCVYFFESLKDQNIIEKIMYNYSLDEKIRIVYKNGKFCIDKKNAHQGDTVPYWRVEKNSTYRNIQIFHQHILTDKTFEVKYLRKGSKWLCEGCGRKAPAFIKLQYDLLTK